MSAMWRQSNSPASGKALHLVKGSDASTPQWNEAFIREHDVAGPRYTSYPTALQFHEEFGLADYDAAVARSNARRKPLSLYIHLPFCASLCYYCACNKVITSNQDQMRRYLDHLIREIQLKSAQVTESRPVYQMHWGGGTPTYYEGSELTELMYQIGRSFHVVTGPKADHSIEIDPRTLDTGKLGLLKGLGFDRLSMGIQDFSPKVQQAVNRIQPKSLIAEQMQDARAYGFRSINFDLIYGLPYQTQESFQETVEAVIALSPDRISVFNYAHLPERFKSQRLIDEEALPTAEDRLRIFCQAAARLTEAGYRYIGMDHFAKPDDSLSQAAVKGDLHRNFQGYTTCKDADLIGLGVSAISQIDDVYCQNTRSLRDYQQWLGQDILPLQYGVQLTQDDLIRREAIMALICHFNLDFEALRAHYGIDPTHYFAAEIVRMNELAKLGLVKSTSSGFQVTPQGRLVIRKVCMVFDRYLSEAQAGGRRFSRII